MTNMGELEAPLAAQFRAAAIEVREESENKGSEEEPRFCWEVSGVGGMGQEI